MQKLELTWIGKGEEPKLEPRILIHDKEKSYGDENTENMLIHGDNLLALKALEQDFAGKIKCIYIDPPYNTGSAFEHYDDGLEHSLWLNLMKQRLELLRELLTEDGVIFISIDDNEVAYLQIVLNEVFGRKNFIANLPTIMNLKGNQDQFGFAGTHEYTLVYAKDKSKVKLYSFDLDEEQILSEWKEDEISYYKKGATLKSTGEESSREDRPNMFYPILIKNDRVESITIDEYRKLYNKDKRIFNDDFLIDLISTYESKGYNIILPFKDKDTYGRWRWGFDTFSSQYSTEIIIVKTKNSYSLYKKQRPTVGEIPTQKPKSLFYKPEYSSGNGTAQIKKLFGFNAFPYPKPEDLIKDIITIGSKPGDWVLDSFLGSGTTGAVAQKMRRKWIGIELGDHCYTHCKPRLEKVIDGTDQGGISKAVNWQGGGGFKFYELAPSLLKKDKYGNFVIDKENYNPEMLAAAVAKINGYRYHPDEEVFWKQGKSTESSYIFTTDQYVTAQYVDMLAGELAKDERLLICCPAFDSGLNNSYENIILKKIPESVLDKCQFGVQNYNMNIIELDDFNEVEEDEI